MTDYLALACGVTVLLFAAIAYRRHHDAFHPAVFTAPLMISGYSLWPLLLNRDGELEQLFYGLEIGKIQLYYLYALIAFYLGMVWTRSKHIGRKSELSPWQTLASTVSGADVRRRLVRLAMILATVVVFAYSSSVMNAGGFIAAYSVFKGGGFSSSGYVGEAVLLAYPAALIYALSRQGRGFRLFDWLVIIMIISPNIIQGTFGVRRGPLFISLVTLFVSWIISKGRPPKLFKVGLGVSSILIAVLFMWSQRELWFAEDGGAQSEASLTKQLIPDTSQLWENDFVSGVGSALLTDHYNLHFWGRRWLVDLVIRPIPRQIWPTKYADVGAYWKDGSSQAIFSAVEQSRVLGFELPAGHATGLLSDLYTEWSWYAIAATFTFGRFLRWLWFKHRSVGQVWTVIYLGALGLSIYLPSQSFSAWYHRFLFMAVGTFVAWRWLVGRDLRHGRTKATNHSHGGPTHLD